MRNDQGEKYNIRHLCGIMNIIARRVSKDGRVKGKPPILENARVRHLKKIKSYNNRSSSSRQHPVLHGDVLFTRAELLLPRERHAHSCEVTDRMCNVIIYFAQMRGGPRSEHAVAVYHIRLERCFCVTHCLYTPNRWHSLLCKPTSY
jgi:hypothetical protein